MDDPGSEALVQRRIEPTVPVGADTLRRRVRDSDERFRLAVQALRASLRELTPAGRVRAHPMAWMAGGLAVGFLLGLLLPGGQGGTRARFA